MTIFLASSSANYRRFAGAGGLGRKGIIGFRNLGKNIQWKISWAGFSSQGAMSLYLRDILASKLAVYPVGRDSPLQGQSLPMTKIAKA